LAFERLISNFHGYVIWPRDDGVSSMDTATDDNPYKNIDRTKTENSDELPSTTGGTDCGDGCNSDDVSSHVASTYALKVGCNVDLMAVYVKTKIRRWQTECLKKVYSFFAHLDSSWMIHLAVEVRSPLMHGVSFVDLNVSLSFNSRLGP